MHRLGLELTKFCPVAPDKAFDIMFGRHRMRDNLTCGYADAVSFYHCDSRPGGQIEIQADIPGKPLYFRGEFVRIMRPHIVVMLCTFRRNWRPTYRVQIDFEHMANKCQVRVCCDDTGIDARDLRDFWKTRLDHVAHQTRVAEPRAPTPLTVV